MEDRGGAWYPDSVMNDSRQNELAARRVRALVFALGTLVLSTANSGFAADQPASQLTVSWADDYLTISGTRLPSGKMRVHYLEAYCRDGSTDRAWEETTIGHKTKLIAAAD